MVVEMSDFGSPELKKGSLQKVCLYVCMQRWRDNYSIDFHRIRYKHK